MPWQQLWLDKSLQNGKNKQVWWCLDVFSMFFVCPCLNISVLQMSRMGIQGLHNFALFCYCLLVVVTVYLSSSFCCVCTVDLDLEGSCKGWRFVQKLRNRNCS